MVITFVVDAGLVLVVSSAVVGAAVVGAAVVGAAVVGAGLVVEAGLLLVVGAAVVGAAVVGAAVVGSNVVEAAVVGATVVVHSQSLLIASACPVFQPPAFVTRVKPSSCRIFTAIAAAPPLLQYTCTG